MSDTINQEKEEGNIENENQNNHEEEKHSIDSQRRKNSRNNSRYSKTEG